MTEPQPTDITGGALHDSQAGGFPKDLDFERAIGVVHGEPEPGAIAAAAFAGGREDPVEDVLRRLAEERAGRGIQKRISGIFERISGGVKLGSERAPQLASAVVSRAANVKVFGQNLADSLDYALHHKRETVTNAVQYALTHKGEILTGAVAGGLGKAAVRGVLTGTGGFLVAAAAGAGGGALAGAAKEYFKQRESIQINKTEKALIIGGLQNEFRRMQAANKDEIRTAALRGAIFGVVGVLIGAEFAEFAANNEWVQEQIAKIRLPEIKLPEVKVPEIRPPEFKLEGTAPSVPAGFAPDFPAPESPLVAEATPVPAVPTVEPPATPSPVAAPTATVEAPAAAPTAVPTPEPTSTPVASPTGTPIPTETPTPVPTGTPTPEVAPGPAVAVQPPAAPEPPAGPSRVFHPTAPTGAPEPPAAPPVAAPEIPSAPVAEPAIGQPPVVPPAEPLGLVEPAPPPAVLPIPAELSVVPEQIPLPAGSNPWEVTGRTLRDILGRDPTNAEILQVTKEVCRQSNIAVPNWEITGEIDHRALPVNYKLVFNDPVKKLIAGMKG